MLSWIKTESDIEPCVRISRQCRQKVCWLWDRVIVFKQPDRYLTFPTISSMDSPDTTQWKSSGNVRDCFLSDVTLPDSVDAQGPCVSSPFVTRWKEVSRLYTKVLLVCRVSLISLSLSLLSQVPFDKCWWTNSLVCHRSTKGTIDWQVLQENGAYLRYPQVI